jgi:6-phosphofructokinase 2
MAAIVTLTMNPALDIATATQRVEPTHKLRCTEPRYDPGGGGINVARAVRALGGEAAAVFPAGGAAGEMIRHLLDQEDVVYDVVAIDGFTRESLAVEERATGDQFRFILPGPEISERDQQRCLDRLELLAPAASYIVASGSLPLGVRTISTRGWPRMLKPSLRELQDLVGHEIRSEREQEHAARDVIEQRRSEIVVLSLGEAGALLATADGCERFPAIPVTARSTVGAGDSMLAGVVLGLTRGLPLREAVRFGMAAGSAALLGFGTALCRRADVERLYAQMPGTRPRM